jgi:hypothetical protein
MSRKPISAPEGSTGLAGTSFNTPGLSGRRGGRTPQENEQPVVTPEDTVSRLFGGGGVDRPHVSGETTPAAITANQGSSPRGKMPKD